jgi:transcriptional regulator with XRE-family HTH domain
MVPDLNAKLARRLRQLRTDHGLTQERLAERAEISPDAVRRLERGGFSPTLRMLDQLARALGLPITELVTFGETKSADRLVGLISFLKGRTEREVALILRIARAALSERD